MGPRSHAVFGVQLEARLMITHTAKIALVIALLGGPACTATPVGAETYHDIGPYDTLGDLRKMLPGAVFTRLHPAWAQPTDVMYEVKGRGLSGTIVVKFNDPRPEYKKELEEATVRRKAILDAVLEDGARFETEIAANRISDRDLNGRDRVALVLHRKAKKTDAFDAARPGDDLNDEERQLLGLPEIDLLRMLANAPDEEISVAWVRWVPVAPIPVARFISKYGQSEKNDYSDEDLTPYRHWVKKGLQAFLSDDEKLVLRVDFQFTREDRRAAWRTKFPSLPIPKWLAEEPDDRTPQERKPQERKPTERKAPK